MIKIRNIMLFNILILIASCASIDTNITSLKYNEILGVGYEHYDGKLFQISCQGNSEASEDYVKQECLKEASQFVHTKGFQYFSILSQDGNVLTQTGGVLIGNVIYPTSSKYHNKNIIITVLKEDELGKFKNFYKVSDYYIPSNG